jgi:hypothetical protein
MGLISVLCSEVCRHSIGAHADHLSEAHLGSQIAIRDGIEQSYQLPPRLLSARFERDRIERSGWRGISIGIFDGSPHQTLRFDDFFKDAVDCEASTVGRLHDVVAGTPGAQVHLADRVRETGPPYHIATCFGSVMACHTSSRGASKSRVMVMIGLSAALMSMIAVIRYFLL